METVFLEWIKNIAIFSVISSLVIKIVPGKAYVPYLRLYTGMVILLLFLHPLLDFFQMNDKLEQEIYRIEEEQRESLQEDYEQLIGRGMEVQAVDGKEGEEDSE